MKKTDNEDGKSEIVVKEVIISSRDGVLFVYEEGSFILPEGSLRIKNKVDD